MRQLILKTRFSLGDVVMMTAAVRDLHRCYPNQFQTDVRTHFGEVWENNPYLTCFADGSPDVEAIDCRYPLINYANEQPYHCLHGYIEFLNQRLNLAVRPTAFRGDIHLATEEMEWASQVHELAGRDIPFWIVAAGGKHDLTIKWWDPDRYQKVIDHFRGKIAFVQVGDAGHHHPRLHHAIDLRGQTNVRELIRLVYHAQGCLSSVTALMHLAAAVPMRPERSDNRPCVVIAGGREPPHWEAYPHHQFLHTVGMLPCCSNGGCWKSRVRPLGDGDSRDRPANLCLDVDAGLPRCMSMITAEQVIQKITSYFDGGAARYLTSQEARAAKLAEQRSQTNTYDLDCLHRYNAATAFDQALQQVPPYPGSYAGRGIVICGGGERYFPCAWVCLKMLRELGCSLPIQLWYNGRREMDKTMLTLVNELGVACQNAAEMEKHAPRRTSGGWELKSYALLHSPFKEVLLLDADNVPVRDPSFLFETAEYQGTGSLFWPDYGRLPPEHEAWSICGVPYRSEPEFESGQMLVHKKRCWIPLNLAFWLNDHSDFFFKHIHGDKETFHLAWRKIGQPYAMIRRPIKTLNGTMCQHDPAGRRLFQHRNQHKWRVFARNPTVRGFQREILCRRFLRELEGRWDGHVHPEPDNADTENGFAFRRGTCDRKIFYDISEKNEYQLPDTLNANGVVIDIGAHIGTFSYTCLQRGARRVLAFEPEPQNFELAVHNLRAFDARVRLRKLAVWRSDRHPESLLHSGYAEEGGEINTGAGTVLVEAQESSEHPRKLVVAGIGLDAILKRYRRVQLLKLACEGSEWPILFTSRLLSRVESLCGEYHEMDRVPTPARVTGCDRFSRKELERFLQLSYKDVTIQTRSGGKRGLFWAANPLSAA
jgi:FkbM family methyltransferase